MQDWWVMVDSIESIGSVQLNCGSSSTAQYYKKCVNKYLESNNYNWRVVVKTNKKAGKYSLIKDA